MITEKPKILWLCEYAIEVRFETLFCRELTQLLSSAKEWLEEHPVPGMDEVVITYQCLTIFYNPLIVIKEFQGETAFSQVSAYLESIPWQKLQSLQVNPSHEITVPVTYGSEDLEILTDQLKLSSKDITELHQSKAYTVHMIGFLPGFPYMGVLPDALHVKRKATPSLKIPKGSVAIAGQQTGIYSQSSPGGWYVLGKTSICLFDTKRSQHAYFKVSDLVRFKAI